MVTLLYKPNHPFSDKKGFVTKEDYYNYKFSTEEDKRMFRGNEPVVLNYITDHMEPLRHMALPAGSAPIDSKSKFRRITKEKGCIEIGNETAHLTKRRKPVELCRQERRRAIKDTIRSYKEGTINEGERAQVKKYTEKVEYIARNRKK